MLFGSVDQAVLEFFIALRRPALTQLLVGLSMLTTPACYIAYGVVLTLLSKGETWLVPTISVVTAVVSTNLKRICGVERPDLMWQVAAEHNGSFPSSHTSAAFAFACAVLLVSGFRWALPLFALAAVVAVARLYLGVHWLSDICGGVAVGVGCAVLIYHIHRLVTTVRD